EPVEPSLRAADVRIARSIEQRVGMLRRIADGGADAGAWQGEVDGLGRDLARAAQELGGKTSERSLISVVLTSAGIAVREGVEAALLIAALLGVVMRSGIPEKKRWVHVGWLAAVAAGAVTWIVTTRLAALSGLGRETLEGVTALVAAAILF